jgi:glutathione S-transferase
LALAGLQRSLHKEAEGLGVMEFTQEEIYHLGESHLQSIAEYLGKKSYFFGDFPTTIDANLYGFLSVIYKTPIDVPLRRFAAKYENLKEFCKRIEQRFYNSSQRMN